MVRVAAEIPIASGCFASQPLVFAHPLDERPGINVDQIDVIQGANMRTRLGGYFPPTLITKILTEMEADDTLVLFLPKTPLLTSAMLRSLGTYTGTVVRAG